MIGGELRQQAEVASQLAVDDHAAGQAKRSENIGQNVHASPGSSGVSVKLSGSPVIFATGGFAYIAFTKQRHRRLTRKHPAFEGGLTRVQQIGARRQ